jgi:hypothetical protein
MTLSRIKRVRGGICGLETDSDEEVEIDKSGTLASGGIEISYTEHLSKRQKQSHTNGHTTADFQRPTEVEEPVEPQSMDRKLRKQARFVPFLIFTR